MGCRLALLDVRPIDHPIIAPEAPQHQNPTSITRDQEATRRSNRLSQEASPVTGPSAGRTAYCFPSSKKESTAHPKAKRCFPEGKEASSYNLAAFRPPSGITSALLYAAVVTKFHTLKTTRHQPLSTDTSRYLASITKILYPPIRKSQHKTHIFPELPLVLSSSRTRKRHRLRNLPKTGGDLGNLGKEP